jgi:hypothetical protein
MTSGLPDPRIFWSLPASVEEVSRAVSDLPFHKCQFVKCFRTTLDELDACLVEFFEEYPTAYLDWGQTYGYATRRGKGIWYWTLLPPVDDADMIFNVILLTSARDTVVLKVLQVAVLGDIYLPMTHLDKLERWVSNHGFELCDVGKLPPVSQEKKPKKSNTGYFAHPLEKRKQIVNDFRVARAKGEVENKNAWAQSHHGITGKTLLSYEKEFPEEL